MHTNQNPTPSPFGGKWNEQKNKIRAQFPNLTDADLHFEEGKKAELIARMQARLGKTEQEIEDLIASLV